MDNIYSELYQQMDIIVLEKERSGKLKLLTALPEWFSHFVKTSSQPGDTISLNYRFPFLDNFLIDANVFWIKGSAGKMSSGVWIERGDDEEEYPLEATIYNLKGRHILTIEYLGETYHEQVRTLQTARENMLTNERLEEEVRKRTAQIREREEQIAMRLLTAAGFRDEETGAHVRRIGLYSEVIGEALGWNKQHVDDIRIAAPMHDLGKIGIPDRILQKPGKLTKEEYVHMQQHPIIGGKMLGGSSIPIFHMATDIAECHHEKWDGSGYPKGLSGENIPISARIVALADVYDALIHKRVYKEAMPEDEVIDYLKEQSGKHFDPKIVELFLDLLPQIRRIKETVVEAEDEDDWEYK